MYDWIELDGIKSTTFPWLVVLNWDAPLMTKIKRDTQSIPGEIRAIMSRYPNYDTPSVVVRMAVCGQDVSEVTARLLTVKKWATNVRRLVLSHQADYFYQGEVTDITTADTAPADASDQGEAWQTVALSFTPNPACLCRVLTPQTGFLPAYDMPIPEQITAQNATAQGAFKANGWLTIPAYDGIYPAELYMVVTGKWGGLQIGGAAGLVYNAAATSVTTLYIDCTNQTIYTREQGQMVNHSGVISGDYPIYSGNAMGISGTNIDIDVKLLAIERT